MSYVLPPAGPGEFLKAVRLWRGYTRPKLEAITSVPRDKIAGIEYGFCVPTFDELDRLWRALKGAPVELARLEETAR